MEKPLTISAQIDAIEILKRVYGIPKSRGGLQDREIEYLKPRVDAAISTLRWVEENEAKIKDALKLTEASWK